MKNLGFILFSLAMLSCAQERIAKPSPFLSPEQMTNFHVDLALLNATTSFNKDGFIPLDSLYAYHGIDSITFANVFSAKNMRRIISPPASISFVIP